MEKDLLEATQALNKNLATIAALLEVQARIAVEQLNLTVNPGAYGMKKFTFEEMIEQLPQEEVKEN